MKFNMSERETRAAFIASLARSQDALARILDSIADVADCSPDTAKLLRDNVRSLTGMQESMAEAVTSLAWRRRIKRRSKPAVPWLQPQLRLSGVGYTQCVNVQGAISMPQSKRKAAATASGGAASPRKRTKRRNQPGKKPLQRRNPVYRKRLTQKENERANLGHTFNNGFNAGFAAGFEDGHQLGYEQQP